MSKESLWDSILEAQKNIPDSEWDQMLPDGSVLHDVGSCHDEIRRLRKLNAELWDWNKQLKEQKNEAEIHRDIITDYMDQMRPYIQSQKKPFSYFDYED